MSEPIHAHFEDSAAFSEHVYYETLKDLNKFNEYFDNAEAFINKFQLGLESGDYNGATFTPFVSNDGWISWTNDRGFTNPSPRLIKGDPGVCFPIKDNFSLIVEDDGHLYLCDSEGGKTDLGYVRGETGLPGTSIKILGWHESYDNLKADHPTGNVGDAYNVAGQIYVWDPENTDWKPVDIIAETVGNVRARTLVTGASNPHVSVDVDSHDGLKDFNFTFTGFEVFTGATESQEGNCGLVPCPPLGETTSFLCSDGTWKRGVLGDDNPSENSLTCLVSVSPGTAKAGSQCSIIITVTNTFTSGKTAENVKISSTLPFVFESLNSFSVTTSEGSKSVSGNYFEVTVPKIEANQSAIVTVSGKIKATATPQIATMAVQVGADNANVITENGYINIEAAQRELNCVFTSIDPNEVEPGNTVQMTITVTNTTAELSAENVVLNMTLPGEFDDLSSSNVNASSGTSSVTGKTVQVSLGTIKSSNSANVKITATVSSNVRPQSIELSASVSADNASYKTAKASLRIDLALPKNEVEFQALSWEDVLYFSKKCLAEGPSAYENWLGWTRPIMITGNKSYDFKLVALNNNEGHGFTFMSTESVFLNYMSEDSSVPINYSQSTIARVFSTSTYSALPEDLREVLTPATIKFNNAPTSSMATNTAQTTISQFQAFLWCPSAYELAGDTSYGITGKQFDYFIKHPDPKDRLVKNDYSEESGYWLRDSRVSASAGKYSFGIVIAGSGTISSVSQHSFSVCVVPCFHF